MRHFLFILFITIGFSVYSQDKFPDGPFVAYFENGNLKTEGQYKSNKKVGAWKGYYKTGELRMDFSYNSQGNRTRIFKRYFKDGTIMHQVKKIGDEFFQEEYYESGVLKHERILDNGYYKEYYEDGTLKLQSNYVDNELSGAWIRFYETGGKEWEVNYKNDYRDGSYRYYSEKGAMLLGGVFKENLKNGEETHYDEDGNMVWKGSYEKGKPEGVWINYDLEGNKLNKLKYNNGKLKSGDVSLEFNQIEVPDGVFERLPVFPGCEECINNKLMSVCDAQKISEFVSSKFNTSFAKEMGLRGQQRINAIFKIDETGKVIDIKARAAHISLSSEAIRVLGLLPKFIPGMQNGKPIVVPYSLPIIFVIQ